MDWRVVPIETWPGEQTAERQSHRFRKTVRRQSDWRGSYKTTVSEVDWSGTVALLERELEHLDAENILLQMAVTDRDIRQDGWIRANARPEHPGVILTFDSRHGPLSYPCDTFTDWQANVRGIAKSLEWLRGVDRYGVSKRGEQYTGWGRLPPAGGSTSTMTAEVAAKVVAEAGGDGMAFEDDIELLLGYEDLCKKAYRKAAAHTHPDHGGSTRDFQLVQEAKRVLWAHHGMAP